MRRAAGPLAIEVDHIGSTAVPGLPAKDVIDLQLVVPTPDDAVAAAPGLTAAGFVRDRDIDPDTLHGVETRPERWRKTFHANADPGRAANLHVRPADGPAWRYALLFRDWLRADAQARTDYLDLKVRLATRFAGDPGIDRYAQAKEPWWVDATPRAQAWADAIGWSPGS